MIKKQKAPKADSPKLPEVDNIETPKAKPSFYLILLLIVVLTGVVLMFSQKMRTKQAPKTANQPSATEQQEAANNSGASKTDIQGLIAKVAKLIVIKAEEEPTIATVQDADTLRKSNPIFYKDADNGDRLLVWSDKAVLYSTKMDKLLAVMPISANNSTGATEKASTSTQSGETASAPVIDLANEKAEIDVRNGTLTAGKAKTMATLIKAKGLTVSMVGDAKAKNYEKTVIIKLSDKDLTATLDLLKQTLNAEVIEKPAAETTLKGDIAVIVGADFNQ